MSGSRIRTLKPERNAPASAARETRRRRLDFIPGTNLDEYAAPWIGLILIVIIGWQLRTHLFTSWWVRIVAGTLAFLCSVVVTFFVSEYARPRNEFLRLHAVGTTLIVGGMLSVSIWAGLARAWLYSLIFLLPTLALTWNVRQIRIIRGEGKDTHDVRNSWIEALGTDGTKVVDVKRDDRTVRLKVRGLHGKSAKDVAALVPGLNAITGLHPGAVRAIESPHLCRRSRHHSERKTRSMSTRAVRHGTECAGVSPMASPSAYTRMAKSSLSSCLARSPSLRLSFRSWA